MYLFIVGSSLFFYFLHCSHGRLDWLQGYREEIDGLQDELNVVQNLGAELMTACGEPDKPVIKKSIDEVTSNKLKSKSKEAYQENVDGSLTLLSLPEFLSLE